MLSAKDGNLLPLKELAAKLPGNAGKPMHEDTLRRWSSRGVRGVYLETLMLGNRRVSSLDAIDEFMRALTALDAPLDDEPITAPQRMSLETRFLVAKCRDRHAYGDGPRAAQWEAAEALMLCRKRSPSRKEQQRIMEQCLNIKDW